MIYLDTHVVIWLNEALLDKFTPRTIKLLESEDLVISPFILFELQYLHEIKRIKQTADEINNHLLDKIGLTVAEEPTLLVIKTANNLRWTREPFDRLITAQAKLHNTRIITRNRTILKHYKHAVW